MNTTTKLKQLAYFGLVSLICLVVFQVARTLVVGSDSVSNSLQTVWQETDLETGKYQANQSPNTRDSDSKSGTLISTPETMTRIPNASRIQTADNSAMKFPVQHAAFDSIPWNSKVEQTIPIVEDFKTSNAAPIPVQSLPTPPIDVDLLPAFQQTQKLHPARQNTQVSEAQPTATNSQWKPVTENVTPLAKTIDVPATRVSQQPQHQQAWTPPNEVLPNQDSRTPQRVKNTFFQAANTNAVSPQTNSNFVQSSNQQQAIYHQANSPDWQAINSQTSGKLDASQDFDSSVQRAQASNQVISKNVDLPILSELKPNANADRALQPSEPDANLVRNDNDFVPRIARASNPNETPSGELPAGKTATTKEPVKKAGSTTPASKAKDTTPHALVGASNFVLAEQPKLGAHWKDDKPATDNRAWLIDHIKDDFSPDPIDPHQAYDPQKEMDVYQGKTLNSNQRPILELGRPWYQLGQLSPGYSFFGKHNNITPQFLLYGDVRTAVASNTQNGDNVSQVAFEANLDFDLKLTGTERFHMFMSPLDNGNNTRWLLDDDEFVDQFDADIDFGYFEGDLGAIVGGFTNQTLPFDLPFAVGVMPLLLQNGVWMEDAFLGIAATIPARSSPRFNISNMDVTFFAGYDKITTDAFRNDDSAARMYGMAGFVEAMNGYFEIDYAFLDDRRFDDQSYHNFGFAFSRRFGRLLSHSTRVIVNAGQSTASGANTADGVLLLSENSIITSSPSTLVPYMNFFAGFDRPQSAARAAAAGGVLRNTGILFESDGMTNYPTLDATANDTFGGALGINLIADDFSQQLVVEMAMLGVMGEDINRNAPGGQYGLGFRYQLPLSNAVIFRADGMYGFLEDSSDVRGLRFELRHKY